ncbi:hypothetical protein LTR20_004933 [Exophiala xenobiotica]|nr:hypothetical protein LTR40_010800 [Exophiala xenobiotica]KAK5388073.1 hypothetical protein LTS13_001009 [Exophiala xenobiotica]KAK5398162.1 hypothetical protein LTR79_004444 [Exophiala xenobiotica]KAK5417770.1 hypothetical protein LTR90_004944 [Exophiala xenobiotica]KAK5464227.1 hypothetical protein LTR20_004933 [Exophiala xenobiotica]
MTSPFANSRDPDFIYAAHQPSHLSPQIPSHSNSEVASIENYGYNRTRDGSEEDLFRGLNSYRVSGTRNHEFKTYLLDGKIEKPWTADKKYKAPRKGNWYILGGLLLAIALSAVVNWRIAVGVPNHEVRLPITIPSAPSINLSGVIKSNLTDLVRGHSTGQQLMAETPFLTKMDFTSFLLSQLRQPKLLKVNYTMGQ